METLQQRSILHTPQRKEYMLFCASTWTRDTVKSHLAYPPYMSWPRICGREYVTAGVLLLLLAGEIVIRYMILPSAFHCNMILKEKENTVNWKRKHLIAVYGELALKNLRNSRETHCRNCTSNVISVFW